MSKERLHYIDIAKGLLILMVLWSHFELICRLSFSINDFTIESINCVKIVWVAFYMPAFFYITGKCTNFKKSFIPFFVKGINSILLPALIIQTLSHIIYYVFVCEIPLLWVAKTEFRGIILFASQEWFLPSLFLSRLIVWTILKYTNKNVGNLLSLLLFVVGVVLYNEFGHLTEVWYYYHALLLCPFMMLGSKFKHNSLLNSKSSKTVNFLSLIPYLLIIAYIYINNISIPYVTNSISLAYNSIPLFFALSLLGIVFIVTVSKIINRSVALEWLGQNSLVLYLLHFNFYTLYIGLFAKGFDINVGISTILFVVIFILTVLSCCLCSIILNSKYFRFILGKFN